ncbi:hypothetical protein [Actinoplanes sp. NPDC026619]|uniref:hypothetical protein n=1 Tax=Actinoplanes sp. NPDC026619 TaxID=3155798 RepID=UPI0033DCB097
MSLTGLPLILLTWALAIAAVVATVRWWRPAGRSRVLVRVAGLVAIEVLVVAGVGLIVNREDSFYPSWQALGGGPNVVEVASARAGRLDDTLDSHGAVAWSPPAAEAWHLAGAPRLIVPAEYASQADRTFPIVVVLTAATDVPAAAGAVTVVVHPSVETAASALSTLPESLGEDARVTGRMAILADPEWMGLAHGWPGHPPVIAGHAPAAFAQADRDLPAPLAAPENLPSLAAPLRPSSPGSPSLGSPSPGSRSLGSPSLGSPSLGSSAFGSSSLGSSW